VNKFKIVIDSVQFSFISKSQYKTLYSGMIVFFKKSVRTSYRNKI